MNNVKISSYNPFPFFQDPLSQIKIIFNFTFSTLSQFLSKIKKTTVFSGSNVKTFIQLIHKSFIKLLSNRVRRKRTKRRIKGHKLSRCLKVDRKKTRYFKLVENCYYHRLKNNIRGTCSLLAPLWIEGRNFSRLDRR